MSTYTELIFTAELKKESPKELIDSLKYMIGETDVKPDKFFFPKSVSDLFKSSGVYFPLEEPVCKMWEKPCPYDGTPLYTVSTRSAFNNEIPSGKKSEQGYLKKDICYEITAFLQIIKPYIERGSGTKNLYAITISDEDEEPRLYYLEK